MKPSSADLGVSLLIVTAASLLSSFAKTAVSSFLKFRNKKNEIMITTKEGGRIKVEVSPDMSEERIQKIVEEVSGTSTQVGAGEKKEP